VQSAPLKVAFFSPLPPVKSGIADYSAALLEELSRIVQIETFTEAPPSSYNPADFDIALYQIGNNPHHDFCYQAALRYPGVPVIHEANLHHLIADITIRRGDWDAYLQEVEFDGGPEALAYAQRVKTLEIGPDYDGVPMLRRLLCASKAAIVHSACVEQELRQAGFTRPVGRIQHGAWVPSADRMGYRQRLGISEDTPLIGAFGFLKPYKRIAESLRAFRRLLKVEPAAKMILVGEPHPEFPLHSIIESLGLSSSVRVIGFAPIDDFVGYLAACDIVLNLRFPTVGENSGTLMRALGLGKAVIVSDVGSFREFPDEICLKVPVDATEEGLLFEYLNLLVSRPSFRASLGQAASQWVERECTWRRVAERYADFLEAVHTNRPVTQPSPAPVASKSSPPVEPNYIQSWAPDEPVRQYIQTHLTRLNKTLSITPPGNQDQSILEMGSYLQITAALKTKLGYGEVRGCYYGPAGKVDHKRVISTEGEEFACEVDLFDAEKDRFPYADESFDTVLCCELLEHLTEDPMFMMHQINRILKPGGHLVLTTPNMSSLRAISGILQGYHPGFFPAYIRPPQPNQEPEARHNREYTPREIRQLFLDAGLEPTLLETGEFRDEPHPEHAWVLHLLERYHLSPEMRGDGIYAVGRKTGAVRDRYPAWLYT
jgi:glycosyltransferase involved in cell wall biosynthesis/SAM-dependent methyltransferase